MCAKSTNNESSPSLVVDSFIEKTVGIGVEDFTDILLLDSIKGFGPNKFKKLYTSKLKPRSVLDNPDRLPISGKLGERFRKDIKALSEREFPILKERAKKQLLSAYKNSGQILTYWNPSYPRILLEGNYPVQLLYVRGSTDVLNNHMAVACVGTRKIRSPYSEMMRGYAETAVKLGFAIVSGFATGADTIGHKVARDLNGQTILVMAGGLDRPFPPENKNLWESFLLYHGAVMVSESAFGIGPTSLMLRKRNKLIVALSNGVFISQSPLDGGAMNAFRFALELRKPVATLESDGTIETLGNKTISAERKALTMTLPIHEYRRDVWDQWLRSVSSLI